MLQKNGEIIITTYDSTDLNEIGMLIISVPRKDINTGNTAKQLKLLNKVEKRKNQLANKVVLFFEGYEEDERELYQIPEVRKWMKKLFKQKPHLFYYLCDFTESIAICYLCLVKAEPVKRIDGITVCQIEYDIVFLKELLDNTIAYAEQCGDSNEEISAMIKRILDALFKNSVSLDEL
ncbi:MAG: hypothetical protein K6T72_03530 [Anoxybacillus sp.]|nr:hypothetical protein [Anoxybacillus sp.]MCL6585579.1 hypothetical protein [Anoxybacillus sp.]